MQKLEQTIQKFKKIKVLVIGEAMLDTYFIGRSERLCREAPVPIVDVQSIVNEAGGGANTAVNVAALGAEVSFLSVVGDDNEGQILRGLLSSHSIDCDHVVPEKNRKTLTKKRVMANNQLLLRYDVGTTNPVSVQTEEYFIRQLTDLYFGFDAIIISDYGYGILTEKIRRTIKELVFREPKILTIDAKYLALYKDFPASLVKPNFMEAVKLLAVTKVEDQGKRAEQIIQYKDQVLSLTKSDITAVTVDSEGAVVFDRSGSVYRTFARPVTDSQAAGAGDTYSSVFTLSLAAKASVGEAAELASAAAAIAISKECTAYCSQVELKEFFSTQMKQIPDKSNLKEVVKTLRKDKKKIVFTNGCFDILHSGHVNYLTQAKALGDILIVGLNSDDSVKRLKGSSRPINNLTDRIAVLSALSSLDYIVPFTEDTPIELIKIVKPDVYVKGGDYTKELLPETPVVENLGGVVTILPYMTNYSTTNIVSKISSFYQHGVV